MGEILETTVKIRNMDRKLQGLQTTANIQTTARYTENGKTYRRMQDIQKTAKHTDECKIYRKLQNIQTNARYTENCKTYR
jgi:hypothetical protein